MCNTPKHESRLHPECCLGDCSINVSHPAAVAGRYDSWSTPYSYLDAYQMQLDTNALVDGACLSTEDTYDMIECPSDTYKLAEDQISGLCAAQGLPCPEVSPEGRFLHCPATTALPPLPCPAAEGMLQLALPRPALPCIELHNILQPPCGADAG